MLSRFLPDSRGGRAATVLALIAALVAGLAVGRIHAYNQSVGGMTAAFGGIIFVVAAVGFLVFAAVAQFVARMVRARRGAAVRLNSLVAAALIVGVGAGWATSDATAVTIVPPVHRESDGATSATILSSTASFVPRPEGHARCSSVDDGSAVGVISALDLGDLSGGTLVALIEPDGLARTARLELSIPGGGDSKEMAPGWFGTAAITANEADFSTGTIEFTDVALRLFEGVPSPAAVWSATLSGTISWVCEPWN